MRWKYLSILTMVFVLAGQILALPAEAKGKGDGGEAAPAAAPAPASDPAPAAAPAPGGVVSELPQCSVLVDGADDYSCACSDGFARASIWGSGPYTADSDICTAAQHKGLIGAGGGLVRVIRAPGRDSYAGTSANGVDSGSWGDYGASIYLFPGKAPEPVAAAGEAPTVAEPAEPAVPVAPVQPLGLADLPDCSTLGTGEYEVVCKCAPGFSNGSAWGSGPYTGDSDICTAALHAGVIGRNGGAVKVEYARGRVEYPASSANGVTTDSWGRYNRSLAVFPGASAGSGGLRECGIIENSVSEMTCTCPAGFEPFDLWGTGTYTADSDICAAAQHAGVIGNSGGDVRVVLAPGLDSYPATRAFGVQSAEWGSYHSSIKIYPASGSAAEDSGKPGAGVDLSMLPVCSSLPDSTDVYQCRCDSGFSNMSIWGSGPYTADSSICSAAQHAGVIGSGGGGVQVVRAPGRGDYPASIRNGIESSSWGSYHSSFHVLPIGAAPENVTGLPSCDSRPEDAERYTCSCDGAGEFGGVWGSNPYTGDSNTCMAARHAGVIGVEGGEVTVLRLPGLGAYRASTMNGIESSGWGSYSASFTFDLN